MRLFRVTERARRRKISFCFHSITKTFYTLIFIISSFVFTRKGFFHFLKFLTFSFFSMNCCYCAVKRDQKVLQGKHFFLLNLKRIEYVGLFWLNIGEAMNQNKIVIISSSSGEVNWSRKKFKRFRFFYSHVSSLAIFRHQEGMHAPNPWYNRIRNWL